MRLPKASSASAALLCAIAVAAGCEGEPQSLRWGFAFADATSRARAEVIEARILRGGCAGTEIYRDELAVSGGATASAPMALEKGRYCFTGRARDDQGCVWFAEGELEVALPTTEDPVIVVLAAATERPACVPGLCEDACSIDGGDGDAGDRDAGPRDADVGDGGCAPGFADCTTIVDGCETNLSNDDEHCGACNRDCGDLGDCSGAICTCPMGLVFDEGGRECRDVQNDPKHCGAIGNSCDSDEICSVGRCVCRPGLTREESRCIDTGADPGECGPSDLVCSGTTPLCSNGTCVTACAGSQVACMGGCVDVTSHPLHCGACSNECERSRVCVSGSCREYLPGTGCTSCPCDTCDDDERCCSYGGAIICVRSTSGCPVWP